MLKLNHLSKEDHEKAAQLLSRAQDALSEVAQIVNRAPFSDRVLRCHKVVQERLIDPLRDEAFGRGFDRAPPGLYPAVHYSTRR